MLGREGFVLSDMSDFGLYQPASGSAMTDPFSVLSLLLPLYVQSEGGPEGMKNLNSLIQMMTGQNIADVFGMGQPAEMVLRPEARQNIAARDFAGSEIGERILADLLEYNLSSQEVVSRLRELYATSPEAAEWVDATAGIDQTTGAVNWNNMSKMLREVVREQAQIDDDFRNAERQFIATQASRPQYGFEGPDIEGRVAAGMSGFDPESLREQAMRDYARMFPGGGRAAAPAVAATSAAAPVAEAPASGGGNRAARGRRAQQQRQAERPAPEERQPRTRRQARRGGGTGTGRTVAAEAPAAPVSGTGSPVMVGGSPFDYNAFLREQEERQRRGMETRLAANEPAKPTADTQRLLQNLQMMMALRGAFGSQ